MIGHSSLTSRPHATRGHSRGRANLHAPALRGKTILRRLVDRYEVHVRLRGDEGNVPGQPAQFRNHESRSALPAQVQCLLEFRAVATPLPRLGLGKFRDHRAEVSCTVPGDCIALRVQTQSALRSAMSRHTDTRY